MTIASVFVMVDRLLAMVIRKMATAASGLLYATHVQGFAVFGRVVPMFLICTCEIVRTAEVFFRAHIKVIMMDKVEHRIDTGHRRNTDRAWGQADVDIGIIRAVGL